MKRFPDEAWDWLKLNNLQEIVKLRIFQVPFFLNNDNVFMRFLWTNTPEGMEYWNCIYNKYLYYINCKNV